MPALRWEDLQRDLEKRLRPAYFITGDETLLVEEACDAIIAAARASGFDERELIQADATFDWNELTLRAYSMSLFAQRKVLDVRASPNSIAKAEPLLEIFEEQPEDTLLLVRTGQLDGRQRKAAWFKRIEAAAAVMVVWPMELKATSKWLAQRSKRSGLDLSDDALAFLSSRVEGNLLAAAQELDKLALLGLSQPVTMAELTRVTSDVTHYDAFDLTDAALAGEAQRVRRIAWALREEGTPVLGVLGALAFQMRRLINDDTKGLPGPKISLMRAARQRLNLRDIETLFALATQADEQVKGAASGDPWLTIEGIALRLAGVENLPRSATTDLLERTY